MLSVTLKPSQKGHWPLAVVLTLFYCVKTTPKNEGEEEEFGN